MDEDQWNQFYWKGRNLYNQYLEEGDLVYLHDAIDKFQRALNFRPHGDADRIYTLDALGLVLRQRYDCEGNLVDLTQAIACHQEDLGLCPPGSPDRDTVLTNLANALLSRYKRDGELADLVQVIQLHQEALDLRPLGHPLRSTSLNNLATALYNRYEREGELADLVQVIQRHQEALDLHPLGHPYRSMSLSNLAVAYQKRYDREGELADLVQVIQLNQQALDLRPLGHPDRSMSLNNLAEALKARYEREGELADLVQVIQLNQQALDLRPLGHPDRSMSLNNLAIALQKRYNRKGELADLMQVIQLHQQALDLRPLGHPDRSTSLNNLAEALKERYEREGELADLVQVIQLHQQALDLHPLGHPLRSMSLSNLAIAVRNRYEQEGELADLVQVIQLNQQALDLRPVGHPDRSTTLNNLAIALLTRYKREGELADLVQVIQRHQQALDLHPLGHPLRSMSLNNLATALENRYDRGGESADLVQVIQLRQQALDLRPPGHPDRSTSLRSLANNLFIKYNYLKSADHLIQNESSNVGARAAQPIEQVEQTSVDTLSPEPSITTITSLLQEASQSSNCSPRDCLWAALDWIKISKDINPDSTLNAYISALQQLDIVMAFGQSLDQRHNRLLSDDLLAQTQGLGSEAATWAIQRGELEHAIELLEQGRTLLLAQVGRYRVEVDDLRRVNPKLADRFNELSQQLDASVVSRKRTEEADSAASDQYGRYRNLSTEWDRTVEELRMLPGLDTFLKPMPYDRLRKAAAEGPIVIIIPNENGSDALIVRDDLPIHHAHLPLANSDRLNELSVSLTKILNPEYDQDVRTDRLCVDVLRCLWKEVVQPIAHALQHDLNIPLHSRMWWFPTSAASFLPLHAAGLYLKEQPSENFPNLFISSYTTTLQVLLRARRFTNATAPKTLLIVSQPHTPGEPPLKYAMMEAEVISNTVSPTREVTKLSAEEGSCKDVQFNMEFHPWVHFICHGVQTDGQPLDSYLSLHDGHLTLRNIIERNLPNADFAFLAACHSAAGDQALSNEGLHLAAAMQFSGFRGVVGTLWTMDDNDGPPLAEAFYRDMVRHGDSRRAAVALNKAINQLRRNKVPINRWIRFIHIGI